MPIRVTVCDDEETERTYLARLTRAAQPDAVVRACSRADAALFPENEADIYLLDIQMPGMDGMSLARRVRERDARAQIVFVTGYADRMAEGYDVGALHYLLKPVSEDKFRETLARARARLNEPAKTLVLRVGDEIVRLPLSEIDLIEAVGHGIVARAGGASYEARESLNEVASRLPEAFFRCHRSYLVNMGRVKRISREGLTLQDGLFAPLSRRLYDAAYRAFIDCE